MIEVSITQTVNEFHRLLKLVDKGESIRITNHGRARARLVPDSGFMSSSEFARIFDGYQATDADKATADDIAKNIVALDTEEDNALAH